MLTIRGTPTDLRQGFSRRDILRVGLGGVLGAGLVAPIRGLTPPAQGRASFGKAKSIIYLYLFGGPSHIDVWDMKPNAPEDRKSTRLNSSHIQKSRMPSSA